MSPLLIDGDISFGSGDFAERARRTEAEGYDGAWSAEVGHDPLLMLAGAATATTSLELGTGIVVAFGRSPMITATMANDVQLLSRGRLLLGLGSQIKPHIEKRYSMPWSHPAPRMREYILAMRAIWSCWNEGTKLDFRGEFYRHTLMTPFFNPGPNPFGPPRIFLAAVGELMTEVAGEVADGLLVHPFTTERYLREVTMPALGRGLAKVGRSLDTYQISFSGLMATGRTPAELEAAKDAVRSQIAFYGSTPAYRGVLELHGWGELQTELNALSRVGDWTTMASMIDEDVLTTFATVGLVDEVPGIVHARFGDVIDRYGLYVPYSLDDEYRRSIVSGLRAVAAG
jgi:probable F420-dependent oxidoreductase